MSKYIYLYALFFIILLSIPSQIKADDDEDEESLIGDIIAGIMSGIISAVWEALGVAIMEMPPGTAQNIALFFYVAIMVFAVIFCIFNCSTNDKPFDKHDAVRLGTAVATHALLRQ
jgi:chemotaxis protein CheY-P-specific phosphatase CheC